MTEEPFVLSDAARRRRSPECASDLALDQLALGELSGADQTRLSAHLRACPSCSQAQVAIAASQRLFLAQENIGALASDALGRAERERATFRPWAWVTRLALPLALAAGAAAVVLWPAEQETRTKGGFSLSTYVLHPEAGNRGVLHAGEPVHPGDKLQFRYQGHRGYLAIVAVDAVGKVSVYYPPGPVAEPVEAGRDLRSAVELDDVLGPEVVVALRCAEPVAVAQVVAAAKQAVERARLAAQTPTAIDELGLPCIEMRQKLDKVGRPTPR